MALSGLIHITHLTFWAWTGMKHPMSLLSRWWTFMAFIFYCLWIHRKQEYFHSASFSHSVHLKALSLLSLNLTINLNPLSSSNFDTFLISWTPSPTRGQSVGSTRTFSGGLRGHFGLSWKVNLTSDTIASRNELMDLSESMHQARAPIRKPNFSVWEMWLVDGDAHSNHLPASLPTTF